MTNNVLINKKLLAATLRRSSDAGLITPFKPKHIIFVVGHDVVRLSCSSGLVLLNGYL